MLLGRGGDLCSVVQRLVPLFQLIISHLRVLLHRRSDVLGLAVHYHLNICVFLVLVWEEVRLESLPLLPFLIVLLPRF